MDFWGNFEKNELQRNLYPLEFWKFPIKKVLKKYPSLLLNPHPVVSTEGHFAHERHHNGPAVSIEGHFAHGSFFFTIFA